MYDRVVTPVDFVLSGAIVFVAARVIILPATSGQGRGRELAVASFRPKSFTLNTRRVSDMASSFGNGRWREMKETIEGLAMSRMERRSSLNLLDS